ncbi:TerC family protein [Buchnera aphidicola (Thelaxes californica)]|uniref:TerC family protein n=1 Tax=Buchnera aphidicola (Thelaxes californica) TaxID=1315998 RepID=A0A4D6YCG7_9GAMM|nr:TerC family protein [Buchnera aphidicola]QCI26782.1 TerC family protein [Buchnera aphidicola (Thelaxes californica)]
MTSLLDPSVWAGLLTLITLEIVLGLDNLLFIAILVSKLPPETRDKARKIGLFLALIMRLGLLSAFSWLINMQTIVVNNRFFSLSGRNLILLSGGIFLLFKATMELHERIDIKEKNLSANKNYASFWPVVIQIVILDAIFSFDSIVTAVGMVDKLVLMMLAIVIASMIMLLTSKILINFINLHQTVVVLCLSFLLIIGLSLVSESLGFYIPKEYLYAAVTFSIFIEFINQLSKKNFVKYQARIPLRQRAAGIILRFMMRNTKEENNGKNNQNENLFLSEKNDDELDSFKDEERYMINAVLTLANRSIRSMMTPRGDISWVNILHSKEEIRYHLLKSPHSLFPVCKGELDEIIGVVRAKELLVNLDKSRVNILKFVTKITPIIVPDTLDPINLLGVLRKAQGNFVVVTNEFGVIQGLITPLDVLEAIAGEFPDADETPDVIFEENTNSWLVKGVTDLHSLAQLLDTNLFIKKSKTYTSLAGLLIAQKGQLPVSGDIINIAPLSFKIVTATEYRIDLVRITKIKTNITM